MPLAVKLTKENVDFIIHLAEDEGFDLTYLPSNMQLVAEDYGQALYLVKDGTVWKNNITYTDMWEADFNNLWKFADEENPEGFAQIIRR